MKIRTILYLAASVLALNLTFPGSGYAAPPVHEGKYKILHVMSYHSPWRWTDGQLQGFQEAMQGVPVDYKVFQMDTKRNSSPEAKKKMGREAADLIESWKPDLVYTSDDDAQEHVARQFVNASIPFVFSGVNSHPSKYGFVGAKNMTGVLEQEHFVESVNLLRQLVPRVKRIAVVLDEAPMWEPVRARMKDALARLPGIEFGPWDTIRTFDEYQQKIRAYHGQVDAIALLGIFNFKDRQGKDVPYQEVLRWTAEHSSLPDFSFWIDRVNYGTLCAVTVSEREQGLAAGRLARAILTEGRSPASLPMLPTVRGLPVISLVRAKQLGISPPTGTLLSSEVITQFDWNLR